LGEPKVVEVARAEILKEEERKEKRFSPARMTAVEQAN